MAMWVVGVSVRNFDWGGGQHQLGHCPLASCQLTVCYFRARENHTTLAFPFNSPLPYTHDSDYDYHTITITIRSERAGDRCRQT